MGLRRYISIIDGAIGWAISEQLAHGYRGHLYKTLHNVMLLMIELFAESGKLIPMLTRIFWSVFWSELWHFELYIFLYTYMQ